MDDGRIQRRMPRVSYQVLFIARYAQCRDPSRIADAELFDGSRTQDLKSTAELYHIFPFIIIMSSDEEDLFADSSSGDDTNELISEAKKKKPTAPKRLSSATTSSKKNTKKAYDSDEEAAALFDSDSDDEKKGPPTPKRAPLDTSSKKSRMEALKAKRRDTQSAAATASASSSKKKVKDATKKNERKKKSASQDDEKGEDKGYDSGDSYNSGVFVRTKEDDDFIDADDEDPDALKELYAEQHFDDERDYDMSEIQTKKKSSSSSSSQIKKRSRASGPDAVSDDDDVDESGQPKNPIMAIVQRMKKQKKEVKKLEELEEQAQELVRRMMDAVEEDEVALKELKPSMKKLILLPEVLNTMTQRDMWRPLLDGDVLIAAGAWIQPLPNGSLGNVTVRHKIIDAIGKMTGEKGVTTDDLKKSGFGKVMMKLYMHKDETADMKRSLKSLMDSWSRPIFQKSENLRDLDTALSHSRRGDTGLGGIAKALSQDKGRESLSSSDGRNMVGPKDFLSKSVKAEKELGSNRVRIPYSKGFQYTVRPSNLTGDVSDKLTRAIAVKDTRESLHKRMLQKTRPVAKNQRSADISIEGRPIK